MLNVAGSPTGCADTESAEQEFRRNETQDQHYRHPEAIDDVQDAEPAQHAPG
jgi:hypothetical protein